LNEPYIFDRMQGSIVSLGHFNGPSGDPDDRSVSAFTNGLAPDAAVDEVECVEEGDRGIDGIGIATDLEVDMFNICGHDSSVFFRVCVKPQKTSSPVCLHGKTGLHGGMVKSALCDRAGTDSLGV
jgi:hypothetical protein